MESIQEFKIQTEPVQRSTQQRSSKLASTAKRTSKAASEKPDEASIHELSVKQVSIKSSVKPVDNNRYQAQLTEASKVPGMEPISLDKSFSLRTQKGNRRDMLIKSGQGVVAGSKNREVVADGEA